MNFLGQILHPQTGPRPLNLSALVLALAVGVILAIVTLKLGILALGVVGIAVALPWFMRDPFRLYLWLIVTWPVLTLYVNVRLPGGVPDLRYERLVVLGIVVLVVMPALALRKKLPSLGLWVAIYVAAQVISYASTWVWGGIVAPDLVIFLNGILLPIALYWLTKAFIKSRWHVKWLLYALICATMIICLTGLYERALNLESPFPVSTGTASGQRYLGVPGGRAAGVLGNPAVYGAVLGVGVLASLACLIHSERKQLKILFALTTAILIYGVFVSFTRSAWIATAATLFIAQFLMKDLWKQTVPLSLIGVIAAALILLFTFEQISGNQILQN